MSFSGSVDRLDMTPDVAAHLASLLAVEARHRMRGIVSAAENIEALRGLHQRGEKLNGSELRTVPGQTHQLCCDCDPCLNGENG